MKTFFAILFLFLFCLSASGVSAQTEVLCYGEGSRQTSPNCATGNTNGWGWNVINGPSTGKPDICLSDEFGTCVLACASYVCEASWMKVINPSAEETYVDPAHGDFTVIPAHSEGLIPLTEPVWFEQFWAQYCPEG